MEPIISIQPNNLNHGGSHNLQERNSLLFLSIHDRMLHAVSILKDNMKSLRNCANSISSSEINNSLSADEKDQIEEADIPAPNDDEDFLPIRLPIRRKSNPRNHLHCNPFKNIFKKLSPFKKPTLEKKGVSKSDHFDDSFSKSLNKFFFEKDECSEVCQDEKSEKHKLNNKFS